MNARLLGCTLIAAALAASPAAAQLYKWTDANGRVQYSDKPPPPGRTGEKLTSSAVSTVSGGGAPAGGTGASAPKSLSEQEQEFRKRRAEQDEAQKKAQQAAEDQRSKQAACQQSQRQLTALQSGQRMTTLDANGERRFMEDADIQQAIQRTQADVQKYCR
jgi:Domain of unknown function (DUF4124)